MTRILQRGSNPKLLPRPGGTLINPDPHLSRAAVRARARAYRFKNTGGSRDTRDRHRITQ